MFLHADKKEELRELLEPVMRFMQDECHPRMTIVLTSENAELLEGQHVFLSARWRTQNQCAKKVVADEQ